MADETISAENVSEVITTLSLNAIIGASLWALFEFKRLKRSVYSPRLLHRENAPEGSKGHRRPAPPPLLSGPLRWMWTVGQVSGLDTLRIAGMDAYCLVRFNYLCLRICLFASFWGLLVLTPLYASGTAEVEGLYVVTLAHVESGSSTLWAALVFAYLFTWHALYVLKGEHRVFAEMREEYLTMGDPEFEAQTRYTTKVESVPAELRSSVALEAYFDSLFPGQIHSAVMCLNMVGLERKVKARELVADKLEKTRARELATGKPILHRERRFPFDCCGRKTGETETEYLAGELRKLNDEIKKEQRAFLKSAQRLNAMDDRLMHIQGREDNDEDGQEEQAGGSAGSSLAHLVQLRDRLDVFLSKKANRKSKWALETELFTEDMSSAPSSHRQDEADTGEDEQRRAQGAAQQETASADESSETAGIEEEIAARKGGPTPLVPGAKPGSAPALSEEKSMVSGMGNLVESAPELAKEALSSLAFVGETAFDTSRRVARGVLYLTLGQRMSTTGFVTFRQMASCAASRQVVLAPRPDWCECEPAPDPRDVVWENIAIPLSQARLRKTVTKFAVGIGAIFWSFPVIFIQFLTSYDELEKIFPWLGNLSTDSILYSLISGYLPAAALVLLMLVLPYVFEALSYHYELLKSHSEVQRTVLNRYYMYQLANIYVTVASGTITSALSAILENYQAILSILGNTFPVVAVYFLDVIIVKALAGLPFELVRGWPLIRVLWSQKCNNKAYTTEREARDGPFGPSSLLYGWVYPGLLLVLVVCFMYAVISPFIVPAGAVYFALAYIIYKHQVLYVYEPKFESGGVFWFSVYPRALLGLALAQFTLVAYLYVKQAYLIASLVLPLPIFIYFYGYWSYRRYLGPAEAVSMETAARIDRHTARSATVSLSTAPAVSEEKGEGVASEPLARPVDPETFEPLMYAQLALTSAPIDPDDCRPGSSDSQGPFFPSEGSALVEGSESPGAASALQGLEAPLLGSRAAARRGSSRLARGSSSSEQYVNV